MVNRLLEKLIINFLGKDVDSQQLADVRNQVRDYISYMDIGTETVYDPFVIRDEIYKILERNNPENAVLFFEKFSQLFNDIYNGNGFLQKPAEAMDMLRLVTESQIKNSTQKLETENHKYPASSFSSQHDISRLDTIKNTSRSKIKDESTENVFVKTLAATYEEKDNANQEILNSLPYTLQGIPTTHFQWVEPLNNSSNDDLLNKKGYNTNNEYDERENDDDEQTTTVLTLPNAISWPLVGLLNHITEPAVLYRNINEILNEPRNISALYDDKLNETSNSGLVAQALHAAVEYELKNYLSLIGLIETEIKSQEILNQQQDNRFRNAIKPSNRVTLIRVNVLLREATQGLRLMYCILKESKNLVGGQILSSIYSYTYNGDLNTSKFALRLLPNVARPFFDILKKWLSCGQLVDPYKEFFVQRSSNNTQVQRFLIKSKPQMTWNNDFFLDEKLIPVYVSRDIAKQIFQIGKTLNFIAYNCNDLEWVDMRRTKWSIDPSVLHSPEILKQEINNSYSEVVNHLNHLLRNKFYLNSHLRGVKDYLLLGKGDFVQLLIEQVSPVLEKPANQLFRHNVVAPLATAIKGSNAQYDNPHVINALDARMLKLGHGDTGWDVFTLDYQIEAPLNTFIFDQRSMNQYLKVFNFLWRIKRVSYTLNMSWRLITSSERQYTTLCFFHSIQRKANGRLQMAQALNNDIYQFFEPLVGKTWNTVRQVCCEMQHFISELEYYINYEVIEMAWDDLSKQLVHQESLSVDEIVNAHNEYLQTISFKALLGGGEILIGELHEILKAILAFGLSINGLREVSEKLRLLHDSDSSDYRFLIKRVKHINLTTNELRKKFELGVQKLIAHLQKENDNEMKVLGVRLDFNGFYETFKNHK